MQGEDRTKEGGGGGERHLMEGKMEREGRGIGGGEKTTHCLDPKKESSRVTPWWGVGGEGMGSRGLPLMI